MYSSIYLSTSASVDDEELLPSPGIVADPFKDPDMVGGGLVPDRGGLPSLSVQSKLVI